MRTNDLKPPVVHSGNTQIVYPQSWREWGQLTWSNMKQWRPLTLETMGWVMMQIALVGLVVLAVANVKGWL